jgi:putative pyruvate formate lyase activating enzyme
MAMTPTAGDRRFLLDDGDFEPACLRAFREGGMAARVEAALAELADCHACPRNCACNRLENETRACHTGRLAIVSSAFPHFGEEDCLRGGRGSGTIFFGLCNLRCAFCQNWDISQKRAGRECDAREIAALMIGLQERGCHNINFVTPEHVAPQVIEAIAEAVTRGLRVPIVYNTSAYDALSSLRRLDGLVDVYMPDFKFWKPETALRLARAKDYPERAREAILEMHRQVGPLKLGPDGLARRGVLVRHLVMPGQEDEAAAIFDWLAREVSPDTYVNVMGQYRPEYQVGQIATNGAVKHPDIDRRPTSAEMRAAYDSARRAGLWRFDERGA